MFGMTHFKLLEIDTAKPFLISREPCFVHTPFFYSKQTLGQDKFALMSKPIVLCEIRFLGQKFIVWKMFVELMKSILWNT